MEEADRILIHSLRQAGTAVPPDVQSLRAFTTELVVEAVVRCLRVINPAVGSGLSPLLPLAMSARFRLAMSLAQACMDLGYPLELGYQNFLYPSEPDLRDLLLFLAERLPSDASEDADQPAGDSAILLRAIGSQIRDQMALPWVPPLLRTPKLQHLQGSASQKPFHTTRLVMPELSSRGGTEPREFQASPLLLPAPTQVPQPAGRVASLLECHAIQLCQHRGRDRPGDEDWVQRAPRHPTQEDTRAQRQRLQKHLAEHLHQAWGRLGAPPQARDLGELLQAWGAAARMGASKGSRFTHSEKFTFHPEPEVQAAQVSDMPVTSQQPEQDTRAAQEQELESLREQLEGVNRNIEEVEANMKTLGISLMQVETECRQSELSTAEREQALRLKSRAVELLPDGTANLAKLQLVVESSAQRVIHLAGQWEKHRVPLLAEYRHLRKLQDCRELESSRRLAEIQELHQSVRAAAEEARRKEEVYKQLVSELETLPRDVSRLAYTQRILEIVGNIRKQKEEITKILSDTKELQKEINSLSGKLDRTFAVTDELVFKDAKKDDAVRKAYKYLAALHENCSQLIQTIEDTGTIMREVRDLEEQIEMEMGKKTLSNLEKIREDYRALRQENAGLLGRVRDA
ncbi:coiled-coil domain-containing protein 22 isoform X1 [Canis lupus baileyi]|uniref:coiled-coil domain-containing protein 22 isoform X1 n=1 Tax=Canis lupus dingo TaxID=286419 RepID=UPI00004C1913|nr:coiled-coil domain-containing protein 22 isoform X1 [Canis lupus dingo]XP_038305938.1 coiled-coil domain-containing protein 22 isoform X1 [Canis lupus familiaris]XP_038320195.1 coiled-coil domain-containing protein 22 isoform X1 [Canis lupus familiaris]XP_038443370.1 coiled-coil domain-containing protein 22 isoform X1 [Canis lupus familiaris]